MCLNIHIFLHYWRNPCLVNLKFIYMYWIYQDNLCIFTKIDQNWLPSLKCTLKVISWPNWMIKLGEYLFSHFTPFYISIFSIWELKVAMQKYQIYDLFLWSVWKVHEAFLKCTSNLTHAWLKETIYDGW